MRFKLVITVLVAMSISSIAIADNQFYGEFLCKNNSAYECYKVQKGDTWEQLFPADEQRDIVKRANRKNDRLQTGMIIAVPRNLDDVQYFDIAPFPLQIDDSKQKLVIFDPAKLAWAAYDENGRLVNWGPASGGSSYCADVKRPCRTTPGVYAFYHMRDEACKSTRYPLGKGGAPMPYCMFFNKNFAIHGSATVPGYNASHGCVRVFTEDAAWLNNEFVEVNPATKTKIIVKPYKAKYDF